MHPNFVDSILSKNGSPLGNWEPTVSRFKVQVGSHKPSRTGGTHGRLSTFFKKQCLFCERISIELLGLLQLHKHKIWKLQNEPLT